MGVAAVTLPRPTAVAVAAAAADDHRCSPAVAEAKHQRWNAVAAVARRSRRSAVAAARTSPVAAADVRKCGSVQIAHGLPSRLADLNARPFAPIA